MILLRVVWYSFRIWYFFDNWVLFQEYMILFRVLWYPFRIWYFFDNWVHFSGNMVQFQESMVLFQDSYSGEYGILSGYTVLFQRITSEKEEVMYDICRFCCVLILNIIRKISLPREHDIIKHYLNPIFSSHFTVTKEFFFVFFFIVVIFVFCFCFVFRFLMSKKLFLPLPTRTDCDTRQV